MMTTETAVHEATQAQYNVIRNYSRRLFDDEWYVTDTYQTDDLLTFNDAGRIIEQLATVHNLAIPLKAQRIDALADLIEGKPLAPVLVPAHQSDPQVEVEGAAQLASEAEKAPVVDVHGESSDPQPVVEGSRLKPIEHGTTKGYGAHKRRKIALCDPCRTAWRDYQNERNQAGKARSIARDSKPEKAVKPRKATQKPRAIARNPAPPAPIGFDLEAWELRRQDQQQRIYEQAVTGLFDLLPAAVEPFPAEARARWLAYAALTLDIIWPSN